MNTIRSFWCQGCVQTDILSGNHKTKSPALVRFLSQIIEASQNRKGTVRATNTQKEKAEKDYIE